MTTPTFNPPALAMIQGRGPYAVPFRYNGEAVRVAVLRGTARVALAPEEYQVLPTASEGGGEVLLSVGAAATHAGQLLEILRDTQVVQDWAGTTAREIGLEATLDRMARGLQEVQHGLARSARLTTALSPVPPIADSVFTLDAAKQLRLVPLGELPKGPRPDHQWDATRLRFELPSGAWGPFTDLQGPPGPQGNRGPRGFQGEKGEAGNFFGFQLAGTVADFTELPDPATADGEQWAVVGDGFSVIWASIGGQWINLGSITTPEAFPVANVIYIQENGSNANSGTSLGNAVRHIERALELAELRGEPTLIDWSPDPNVITQGHLDMPDDCVIVARHRTVFIRPEPGFEERNVFRMGNGCFLEGPMFEGFRVDSLTDPTEGFAVSFRPGAVIRRVPYAHKIAVRTPPSWGLVPPPLDRANGNPLVPRGGGVVLADGAVCSQYSIFPNIMAWGATPVTPNGLGYVAKRGGLVNAVNAISLWAHKHYMALSGGQIICSACSNQFGDYAMHADGFREVVEPQTPALSGGAQSAAAALIEPARAAIIDAMWLDLTTTNNPGTGQPWAAGWTASDEAFTRSDGDLFLQCVIWVLASGDPTPIETFTLGLFDTMGQPVFAADKLAAFQRSFETMGAQIAALDGIGSTAQAQVAAIVAAVNATLAAPDTRKELSRISAVGHTWQGTLLGVALTKIPRPLPVNALQDSILRTNEGEVIATGYDDFGNGLLAQGPNGTLEVDAQRGLTGSLFRDAVRREAQIIGIMGSF